MQRAHKSSVCSFRTLFERMRLYSTVSYEMFDYSKRHQWIQMELMCDCSCPNTTISIYQPNKE